MSDLSFSQKLWGAWKDYDRLVRHKMFGWDTNNETSDALQNLFILEPGLTARRVWQSYTDKDRKIAIELAENNYQYSKWSRSQKYFKVLDFLEKLICKLEDISDIIESDHCPEELKAAYVPKGVAGDLQRYKSKIEQLLKSDSLQSATKAILETLRDSLGFKLEDSKELFKRKLVTIRNQHSYNEGIKKEISRLIHSDILTSDGINTEIASAFQGIVNSFFDFCIKNQPDESSSSLDIRAIK